MSLNIQIQKKKLIKEGSIAFAVVAILGGLAGFSNYMASRNEQQISMLQGQFNGYMGQLSELERKYQLIKESVEEYLQIKKKIKAGYYTLDREKAKEILSDIGKKHRIDKISTQMSPIETLTMPDATFQRADVQFSDVRLSFKAMSDLHVYAFIDSLMQELPGVKKITGLSISMTDKFSNGALIDMSSGKKPEIVNAEISFLWMGIRLFDLDPSGNPIPPPAPTGATP